MALERLGPPIYVYHEIVHNRHVVDRFAAQGLDLGPGLKEGAIAVTTGNHEIGTGTGEGEGEALPEAAAGTADKGGLSGEIKHEGELVDSG